MYPSLSLFGESLSTYLILISLIYTMAIFYVLKRTAIYQIDRVKALDTAMIVMLIGFLGARLFHVFYEEPSYYLEDLFRIFYIWQGGFVYFGGAIAAFIGVKFYCRKKQISFESILDLYAPIIILGYAIGRVACLLGGCCYGDTCDLPWAIQYPNGVEAPAHIDLHPTPIYASLFALVHYFVLIRLESTKKWIHKSGDLFFMAVMLHSIGRLLMESFRGDYRGAELLHLSVSSWISIVLFLWALAHYKKKET